TPSASSSIATARWTRATSWTPSTWRSSSAGPTSTSPRCWHRSWTRGGSHEHADPPDPAAEAAARPLRLQRRAVPEERDRHEDVRLREPARPAPRSRAVARAARPGSRYGPQRRREVDQLAPLRRGAPDRAVHHSPDRPDPDDAERLPEGAVAPPRPSAEASPRRHVRR